MTTSTALQRFATYGDLRAELLTRGGDCSYVTLDGAIEREALAEYRAQHGRYNEHGVEVAAVRIRAQVVGLVNGYLDAPPLSQDDIAALIIDQRQYAPIAWAVAQRLKTR